MLHKVSDELTPQELELVEILSDPVKFASHHFEWFARDYQITILYSPLKYNRIVTRCGRRIGKCWDNNSNIITNVGPVNITDLYMMESRPNLITFDEITSSIKEVNLYDIEDNGHKPVFRITTKTGRTNQVTDNHPFFVIDNQDCPRWLKTSDLQLGDRIAVPTTYEGLIPGKSLGATRARLLGNLCDDKSADVMREIMTGTPDDISIFLDAYYDSHGWHNTEGESYFGISSSSEQLARNLQHLLLRIGVISTIKSNDDGWYIAIYDDHIDSDNEIIMWDEVISIEYIGERQTYHISVPETSTVIADDIISHNTESMCVHILWYAFTHENAKMLIAAPYENQIKLVFKRLRELIKKSPEYQSAVLHDRRHPEYIELRNGSTIQGFTAGTKSGAGAANVRGQAADWIYLDEMDYLADEDVEAIAAIALERPEIGIWASSTPTGKRGLFWKWCTNPDHLDEWPWHEIYFPSTVLPTWNKKMEAEFRTMFRGESYEHEVMAGFGEETIGVFKKEHVDRAIHDYKYTRDIYDSKVRTIGVDWDKYGEATQIVVVEFDPQATNKEGTSQGMFKIVWREEIPSSERTLDKAVHKIKDLNFIYQPTHIYVDRGFGEYQVEMLHKLGEQAGGDMSNPAYGLNHRVKGISFAEKVVVRDPWTKMEDKKDVKPWMVNQAQIIIERDQLMISKYDKIIIKQLTDYQVIRQTVTGRPVYTSVNEHALDALMLALLAMSMEHPDIARILQQMDVARRLALVHHPLAPIMARDQQVFTRDQRVSAEEIIEPSKRRYSGFPTWGKRGSSVRHGSKTKLRRSF